MFVQTDCSAYRKQFSWLLFFLIAWLLPAPTQALHIIGGEVTYKFVSRSGNTVKYKFTMTLYRDCRKDNPNAANFDDDAIFGIYRGSLTSAQRETSFKIKWDQMSIGVPVDTPKCVSEIPNVCVERGTYEFTRDLQVLTDQSYFIVYQRCCRNTTITNIISPGEVGATMLVELTPAAMQLGNNSPTFKKFPPVVICNTLPIDFDHSAVDSDGDRLEYSFCSPLAGGGRLLTPGVVNSCSGAIPDPPCGPSTWVEVPFLQPAYTADRPLGGDPVIQIDPTKGLIIGRPNKVGQYVVGVCVSEYRDGRLLSVIRREFQFNVADCKPKVVAVIDSDTTFGARRYVLSSCGDNTVTFKNESLDRRFITAFEWQFDLHGTPFSNKKDWDPTITFPDTGFYRGKLLLNPGTACSDTGYIAVNIHPPVKANFAYSYDTCVAGPVAFRDLSTGAAGITTWRWAFDGSKGSSQTQSPTYLFDSPGFKAVRLRVIDRNKCAHDTTRTIKWLPVPPLILLRPNTYLGCQPANIIFTNLSSPIDNTYKIEWDFGDGNTAKDIISPTHSYTKPGVYDVRVRIVSPIGCMVADTFAQLIRVEESPKADFEYTPSEGLSNFNNSVQFTDKSTNVARWNWTFDRFGRSALQNPLYTFRDTGKMKVTLLVTHPRGCQDSISKYLDIIPLVVWHMPNAFTPNGDGTNEGFLGKGVLDGVQDFRMTLWNRWGEMVYETTDPLAAWNGRKMNTGDMSPPGVYVYVVTFTAPRGERFEYKGFATLVR